MIHVFGIEMIADKRKMDNFGYLYKFLTKDANYYNMLLIYIIGVILNVYMMFTLSHDEAETPDDAIVPMQFQYIGSSVVLKLVALINLIYSLFLLIMWFFNSYGQEI